MKNNRILKVNLYQETIGYITKLPSDKNLFTFDERYVEEAQRPILSLSFKDAEGDLIREVKMTQTRLPPFFSNLLPEGDLREYLAKRAGVDPQREFLLLEVLGRDLPGAVTVELAEESAFAGKGETTRPTRAIPLRFSLAGLQLKFSAVAKQDHQFVIPSSGEGGQWIVKLPHTVFERVPENEYSMMELARRMGIEVPATELIPLDRLQGVPQGVRALGEFVYAVKRFDRDDQGQKIHIEDFAQVFGVYPEKKHKSASYRNIVEVIWKEIGEEGVAEFIKRFVFNALIGNGDMHIKNFSLIYPNKTQAALAPAYDFVSTIFYLPQETLALNFSGTREFSALSKERFKQFAQKSHLPERWVLDIVEQSVDLFFKAWKTVKELPLKKEMCSCIEKHFQSLPFI